jgi:hypothetical protein
VEDQLIVGRYAIKQRVPHIQVFLPIGDLFDKDLDPTVDHRLTEEEESESGRSASCPDPRGDEGGREEDREEDGSGEFVSGHVDHGRVRRGRFQGAAGEVVCVCVSQGQFLSRRHPPHRRLT